MIINGLTNDYKKIVEQKGIFGVLEYEKDLSVTDANAYEQYFMSKMNVRRRQVIVSLENDACRMEAGALQWMAGNITVDTDIKDTSDFLGKIVKGVVTNESAVKPLYSGTGCIVLEPTYKFPILIDVAEWGPQGVTISDGMYYASEKTVEVGITARKNISSSILGGEGIFNVNLVGSGIAVLECDAPFEEFVEIELNNEELRLDGKYAVCWSTSLDFTVEKSTSTLAGSLVSKEGFLNVFRGTGKIWISPVATSKSIFDSPVGSQVQKVAKSAKSFIPF